MVNTVNHVPDGYHTVTTYLTVRDAVKGIAFYEKAFGATELTRLADEDGKVQDAEIKIGDSTIMLSDEFPGAGVTSPQTLGGTSVGVHLFVEDAGALVARAVAEGAEVLRPVAEQFFGVRNGILRDPFGHRWIVATRTDEVDREETRARFEAM